jgi:hypothetical protein
MTRTRPEYAVLTIKHFIILHPNEFSICQDPKHKPCLVFIMAFRQLLLDNDVLDEELGTMAGLASTQKGQECLLWLDAQEKAHGSSVDQPKDSWAANITVK